VCTLLKDLPNVAESAYLSWDGDRTRVCQCDFNYFGPDCSQRRCPTGDDPNTHCFEFGASTGKVGMTQQITYQIHYPIAGPYYGTSADGSTSVPAWAPTGIDSDNMPALASQVHALYDEHAASITDNSGVATDTTSAEHMMLRFEDDYGHTYTAPAIGEIFSDSASSTTALTTSVSRALESLPNKKIKDTTVNVITPFDRAAVEQCLACTVPRVQLTVRFNPDIETGNMVGTQNMLQCPAEVSCNKPGCRPRVSPPYAIRYVGLEETGGPLAYDGGYDMQVVNWNANLYTAFTEGRSIKLHPDSDPKLPAGGQANNLGVALGTPVYRFDGRIEIVVVDHPDSADDVAPMVFYKVGKFDGSVDTADGSYTGSDYQTQDVRFKPSELLTRKTSPAYDDTTGTMAGYTFMGRMPGENGWQKVAIPGAPGVWVVFPSQNPVATAAVANGGGAGDADGKMMVYEVVWKLPSCEVETYTGARDWQAVSKYVENVECSGRGECNYDSGECACYSGYTGQSCSVRTTIA
jgi:hypothetical protein